MYYEYPYTNLNQPNLDGLIRKVHEIETTLTNFTAYNKVHFEGVHDPGKEYSIWAVVEDGTDGNGYISIKAVPGGVTLDNTEYWVKISSYISIYTAFNDRITELEEFESDASDKVALFEKQLGNVITPEMFGAVGDGVADDTAAIQAAINAAATGDDNFRAVYFPHKAYRVTATINITTNRVVLYGNPASEYNTEILADGVNVALFNVTKPTVGFYYLNLRPYDGEFTNIIGVKFDMVSPYDCDGEFIKSSVYNFATGIKLIGKNLNVFESNFSHCDIGVHVEVSNFTKEAYYRGFFVSGCRFHNCGEHSSYSDDTACIKYDQTKAEVINQFFISNNYADLGCTFFRGQLQGGVISNNYIVNVHNDGIVCDNSPDLYGGDAVTYWGNAIPVIVNNYIATTASPNSDYGINIIGGYRCLVLGNMLTSFSKSAIRVDGAPGTTICNNVMYCRGSEYNINIYNALHCIVHGNVEQYTATAPDYSLRCLDSNNAPAPCDYSGGKLFGAIQIVIPHEKITGVNTSECTLYKSGNIVTAILGGATSGATTTADAIVTIPEKYRPPRDIEFLSTYDSTRLVLRADSGKLQFSTASGSHPLRGSITYMTDK